MPITGARNPKDLRVVANVTTIVNDRIERLADATGQNKGVTVAMCITAGLRVLEDAYDLPRPAYSLPVQDDGLPDQKEIDRVMMRMDAHSEAEKLKL